MSDETNQPLAKLMLGSLDEPGLTVKAQFNPRELQISRNITWGKHANVGQERGQQMEFTGQEGRESTVEFLFDATEGGDIMAELITLETLAVSKEPSGDTDKKRRPHHCVLVWGSFQTSRGAAATSTFPCVITSLTIKYQMFSPGGKPLRASATVVLKEAESVSIAADSPPPQSAAQSGTPPATPNK
jgi:hypothetical protein